MHVKKPCAWAYQSSCGLILHVWCPRICQHLDSWGEKQGKYAAQRKATVLVWCSYQCHSGTDSCSVICLQAECLYFICVLNFSQYFISHIPQITLTTEGEFQWVTFWSCSLDIFSLFVLFFFSPRHFSSCFFSFICETFMCCVNTTMLAVFFPTKVF